MLLCTALPATAEVRVHDGDTLTLDGTKIRVHGIDAPELDQKCLDSDGHCYPCGVRATDFLKALVAKGPPVCISTGQKSYQRTVADCVVGHSDVGQAMIRAGWAVPYEKFIRGRQRAEYNAAFDQARAGRRGMHSGSYDNPDRWRRGSRLRCRP